MWNFAAGASNSKRKPTGRMSMPRQGRRGHDPTNPPFEALPRLPSLGGYGNGALLQGAIPGRQYLSAGHGHSLSVGLSLSQVLLYPLPLYNALPGVLDPAFRRLHFRPQNRPQDSSRQIASLFRPSEKDRTLSRVGRGTSPPQASPFGNAALAGHSGTGAFHRHRYRGRRRLGKNGKLYVPIRRADFGVSRPGPRPAHRRTHFGSERRLLRESAGNPRATRTRRRLRRNQPRIRVSLQPPS